MLHSVVDAVPEKPDVGDGAPPTSDERFEGIATLKELVGFFRFLQEMTAIFPALATAHDACSLGCLCHKHGRDSKVR